MQRAKALRSHTHDSPDIRYLRTDAERAANVTPTNYFYPPGDIRRYGGFPSASAATNNAALTAMFAVCATHAAYVPAGIYQVTAAQTIPDLGVLHCEPNAYFYYTDSISAGAYFLTNGIASTRSGGFVTDNLSIVLRTGTACGIRMLNNINSELNNTYIEGFIPADWPTSSVAINARTSIGLRIESSAATDSFFNRFNGLYINHVHFGISFPGGIQGRQYFKHVSMFGDSIYGDTTAIGWDLGAGGHTIVDGVYMDAYASGGAFKFAGPGCNAWRIHDAIFDAEPGAATVGAITSGVTVPLKSFIYLNSGGLPTDNQFTGDVHSVGCSATDVAASAGNFAENNPNLGTTWTATLVPQTSGTITLGSGVGGDTCFCESRGKMIRVWGNLVVASVSAPVGRLQIQGLPFTIANSNANYTPLIIQADGLQATAATALQGYGVRNSATIEVQRFAAGVASTATAADIKAGSTIVFELRYVAA